MSRFIPDFIAVVAGGAPTFIYKVKRTLAEVFSLSLLLKETKTLKDTFSALFLNTDQQFRRIAFAVPSATVTANEIREPSDSIILAMVAGDKSTKADAGLITLQVLVAGAFTFTVPAGVTKLSCSLGGAAGGGAVYSGTYGGGGGGGGAFSRKNTITVTPGQVINGNIGVGGAASTAGGDTWFSSAAVALAKGGAPGAAGAVTAGGAGGAGGAAGSGIGDVLYSGGVGGAGALLTGGGGGGGAGSTGNGSAASGATAGTGTATYGGTGGTGASSTVAATTPAIYGGGGGGSAAAVAGTSNGAQGFATITYTV